MWRLLKNVNDWQVNCGQVLMQSGMTTAQVEWGGGPTDYPCLAATVIIGNKALSAFVYRNNALELLASCKQAEEVRQFGSRAKVASHPELTPDAMPVDGQANFNRWVSAHFLTIAYFLRETGICKEEQFEYKLLESLVLVDEVTKKKTEDVIKNMNPVDATMLDRLDPTK